VNKRQETRRAKAAAAKQRRQKVIAFGGLGVLAILMVIQGPKLLDAFGGSNRPAPATSDAGSAVPAPTSGDRSRGRSLRFKSAGADPFATRALADNDPRAEAVAGPSGTHDPFAQSRVASSPASSPSPTPSPAPQLPKRIVIGTPTPNAVAKRGWIVILASIQTRVGRSYAEQFAARARRDGVGIISVLDSSTKKTLRSGYYVVYTGPFATLDAVQQSAAHVHAFGYRTAYIREIVRY